MFPQSHKVDFGDNHWSKGQLVSHKMNLTDDVPSWTKRITACSRYPASAQFILFNNLYTPPHTTSIAPPTPPPLPPALTFLNPSTTPSLFWIFFEIILFSVLLTHQKWNKINKTKTVTNQIILLISQLNNKLSKSE